MLNLSWSQPTTTTIYINSSGKDSEVKSAAPTTNYNASGRLNVSWASTGSNIERFFVSADLSSIPSNAIITAATLNLYCYSVDNNLQHPIYIRRVSTSWVESTITWNNQPSATTTGQLSFTHAQTSTANSWHSFNVLTHVQDMVNFPSANYGWRISMQTESGTGTKAVNYRDSEQSVNTSHRPYVQITYVLPIEVAGTVHHCTAGQNDGFIDDIIISEGSETYSSYEWFKYDMGTVTSIESGTNFANIGVSSLADGLYLLRVTDNGGLIGYKYFIVGEYGATTTVDFRNNSSSSNSALFNEDACPSYTVSTADGTVKSGTAQYMYAYNSTSIYYSTLLNYKVDFDSLFDISVADLRLYSMGHYRNASPATTDSGYVSRVTSSWEEGIVTWNTKPTKTATDRQLIPPTSPAGSVTRHDTIDLTPFVEYWQENPDENYGIDLSLTQYGQPSTAYLRYRSYDYATASQRPSLLLTFSLPDQVVTEFNDSTGVGKISLIAPNGELPYKFLISRIDTLPVLDDVWDDIKDSLELDSASFFQGQFNTHSHTFENLPADRYFLAVYDNTGEKIFDHQLYLKPSLRLADTSDVIISGDTLFVDSPATSSRSVHFDVISMEEDGGAEIQITQLDDDIIVGFNNLTEPKVVYEGDFEYAIKVEASGTVTFLQNGVTLSTTTASVGDKFRIAKEGNSIVFYKNGGVRDDDAIRDTQLEDFKTEIHLKGPAASVMFKPYGKVKPVPQTYKTDAVCGENLGTLTIFPGNFHGYSITGYSLVNDLTDVEFDDGTITTTAVEIENIPVGIYDLITTWSNGYSSISTVTEIVMGYRVHWIEKTNITEATYPTNAISPTNYASFSTPGLAKSLNTIGFSEDYWLQYQQKFPVGAVSLTFFEIKNLDGDIEGGIAILRTLYTTFAAFYSSTGWELLETGVSYAVNPYAVQLPTGSALRITHSGGDITIRYQNTDLVVFASTVSGLIRADVKEYGHVLITNSIASFCYPIASPYVKLRRTIDGGHYLANEGILNVEYDEEYNDDELEFYVYQETGNNEVGESSWTISPISYGDNRLSFSFTNTTCLANGYYILEIVNKKNEKRYLRFKIVNSTC